MLIDFSFRKNDQRNTLNFLLLNGRSRGDQTFIPLTLSSLCESEKSHQQQQRTTAMSGMSGMSGMTESSGSSGMMSGFNNENFGTMLFSSAWIPITPAGYAGSWLFLFFLAIIWRALVLGLSRFDKYQVRKHESYVILVEGGKQQASRAATIGAWRWSVNLPRAVLATVNQGIAYLLYATLPSE